MSLRKLCGPFRKLEGGQQCVAKFFFPTPRRDAAAALTTSANSWWCLVLFYFTFFFCFLPNLRLSDTFFSFLTRVWAIFDDSCITIFNLLNVPDLFFQFSFHFFCHQRSLILTCSSFITVIFLSFNFFSLTSFSPPYIPRFFNNYFPLSSFFVTLNFVGVSVLSIFTVVGVSQMTLSFIHM